MSDSKSTRKVIKEILRLNPKYVKELDSEIITMEKIMRIHTDLQRNLIIISSR